MFARHLQPLIRDSLTAFPVVAVLGARQAGKSTLAKQLPGPDWPAEYTTLDDRGVLDHALSDPDGFADGLRLPAIIDEIQRAPDLLRAIKRVVDRDRRPGMFVLTGRANILTMKSVSETLAGRVALFDLAPLSLSELLGNQPPVNLLEALFDADSAQNFLARLPSPPGERTREELCRRILSGGYPQPATMEPGRNRAQWFEAYRQTYVERDLRDMSRIQDLPEFSTLLSLVAARSSQVLNLAGLSRETGQAINTVKAHIALLETTYQIWRAAPWFANIGKRLVKRPKLYFGDTGMTAHLQALDDWDSLERAGRAGPLVETWVGNELRKLVSLLPIRTGVHFYRTHAGLEVDFILSRGTRLAAIEVRWAANLADRDRSSLKALKRDLGEVLNLSVVLYSGRKAFAMDARTVAVPILQFFAGAP